MNTRMTNLLLLMLAAAIAGCGDGQSGYTMKTPYRENIATVDVPIWNVGPSVYRRGIEMQLTEAIQKRMFQWTPYRLAPRSRADTLLEGTIDRIDQRPLSKNPDTGLPIEMEIRLTVSFTWTDLRTGEVLVKETGYSVTATYIPETPFDETFFQGNETDMDKLARQIVEKMQALWGTERPAVATPATKGSAH